MDAANLSSLIADAAGRPPGETAELVRALCGASHPGRGDRTHPGGREWMQRWTPRTLVISAPRCGCATGRCPVCN